MKSHNYNNPTGTDSEGPYWLNTETGEKLRWNGPMVGESNTYPPISNTPIQELSLKLSTQTEKDSFGRRIIQLSIVYKEIVEALEKEKKQIKILVDALEDIKNWDDDLEVEWGDCGYRAITALKEFNNQNQ